MKLVANIEIDANEHIDDRHKEHDLNERNYLLFHRYFQKQY